MVAAKATPPKAPPPRHLLQNQLDSAADDAAFRARLSRFERSNSLDANASAQLRKLSREAAERVMSEPPLADTTAQTKRMLERLNHPDIGKFLARVENFEEALKLEAGTCAALRALPCKAIEEIVSEPSHGGNINMQKARVLYRIGELQGKSSSATPVPEPVPGSVNVKISKLVNSKWETEAEIRMPTGSSASVSASASKVLKPGPLPKAAGSSASGSASGGNGSTGTSVNPPPSSRTPSAPSSAAAGVQPSAPKTPYQSMLVRIQAIIAQHKHTDLFKDDINKFVKKHRLRSEVALALQMLSSSAAWGLMQVVASGGAAYANDASILYQVRQLHEPAADMIDQLMRMDPSAAPAAWGYGYNPWSYAVQWGWMAAQQAKRSKKKDKKKHKKEKKESRKQKKGKRKSSDSSYTYESYEVEEQKQESCSTSKRHKEEGPPRNEELERESSGINKRPRQEGSPRHEELEVESCSSKMPKQGGPPRNEELEEESRSPSKMPNEEDTPRNEDNCRTNTEVAQETPEDMRITVEAPKSENSSMHIESKQEEAPTSEDNSAQAQMARLQALMEGLGGDDDEEDDDEETQEERQKEKARGAREEKENEEADASENCPNHRSAFKNGGNEPQSGTASALQNDSPQGDSACDSQQEPQQTPQPNPVEQDRASTDEVTGVQPGPDACDVPQDRAAALNDIPMSEWLKGLDGGKGALLQYLPALIREFDADLSQLPGVILSESKVPGIIGSIDPSMWQACGVVRIGHRMLLAKAINALASR